MRELAVFSRQFATLIASGMPMLRSLYTLEEQTEDERLKERDRGRPRRTSRPAARSRDAMERQPQVFDTLFRAMVRSGESSGRLEEALDRVAFQLEKLDALRRQVRSAMMYPAFVFAAAVVIMLAVVTFIVPVFVDIFKEIVADNPGESASSCPSLTQITVGVSDFLTGYWFIWIPALIGADRSRFFQWKKTDRGRAQWDRFKLELPVQDRRRRPEGRAGALVAHLLGRRLLRRADAAGDQDHRPDGRQRRGRAGDGRRLRTRSSAAARSPTRSRRPTSSRRWSATWSPSARRRGQLEHDADQGRRLLRGRGRRQGQGADLADRAGDDRLRRRHGRLHRDLDVPADLQPLRQDSVAATRPAFIGRKFDRIGLSTFQGLAKDLARGVDSRPRNANSQGLGEKGKPAARWGRKANGALREISEPAGLPPGLHRLPGARGSGSN